jgi:hypothetical protein
MWCAPRHSSSQLNLLPRGLVVYMILTEITKEPHNLSIHLVLYWYSEKTKPGTNRLLSIFNSVWLRFKIGHHGHDRILTGLLNQGSDIIRRELSVSPRRLYLVHCID